MLIGLEIIYTRMCSAIFLKVFLRTLDFLNKIFLTGDILFFDSPLKHHKEYLFSLLSCIELNLRGLRFHMSSVD